jgi:hypothetical protein
MPFIPTAMKNAKPPAKKKNRVQFPTQRVAPETYAKAQRLRHTYGSLGRVLDAALAKL